MTTYTATPLPKFGIEVKGFDLKDNLPLVMVERIRDDVTRRVRRRRRTAATTGRRCAARSQPAALTPLPCRHRLVVFRDQGVVSGQRQVEISRWFGELESTFFKHPRSPHPDVFRVSNDDDEGCTGVGRTGWHVDGSFQRCPFAYSLYHIVSVPRAGDTVFAPLSKLIAAMPDTQRRRFERLWMRGDRRSGSVPKPLIYRHPSTGASTFCFHLGMTASFVWDYGTAEARETGPAETDDLLQELEQLFRDHADLIYSHRWEAGDFIITDNQALGHEASEATQLPRAAVGLRVMHRTTVGGTEPPAK
jgi:taurine dioxygenase